MSPRKPQLFDLRAGSVEALQLSPRTGDEQALREALAAHLDASPEFFRDAAVVIDLRRLPDDASLDPDALAEWLSERGLRPLGLVAEPGRERGGRLPLLHVPQRRGADTGATDTAHAADTPERAHEETPAGAPAVPPASAAAPSTVLVDRPLRSGQRVYSAGDVIVLDAVSHGAEIIAGGNIHVYAPLRGRALAGAHGDTSARIFCSCLEPELVAIAGVYRTAEQPLPAEVSGKSAQVLLDGDSLRFEPLRGR